MADTNGGQGGPPGPGWWLASDGNWYPPSSSPGYPPPPPPAPSWTPTAPAAPATQNGMSVAALVCGILSILAIWAFGVGVLLGVLAIVFGVIGRRRADEDPNDTSRGQATAGFVCGIVGVVGGLFYVLVAVLAFGFFAEVVEEFPFEDLDGVCVEEQVPRDPDC